MATTEQYDKARKAVQSGLETPEQRRMVEAEAKQAGSRGNAAKAAIQGK